MPVLDPANVLSQSRRADCAAITDGARMAEARFEFASLDSEGGIVGAVVRITTSGQEPVEVDAVGSTPDLDVRVLSGFPTTIRPGDSVAVAVELAAVAACADPRAEVPVTVRAVSQLARGSAVDQTDPGFRNHSASLPGLTRPPLVGEVIGPERVGQQLPHSTWSGRGVDEETGSPAFVQHLPATPARQEDLAVTSTAGERDQSAPTSGVQRRHDTALGAKR